MGYSYSLNDIGGVASSFHGFCRGGDRSRLSASEGGMSEGEVSPAAKPNEMTSDETPECNEGEYPMNVFHEFEHRLRISSNKGVRDLIY